MPQWKSVSKFLYHPKHEIPIFPPSMSFHVPDSLTPSALDVASWDENVFEDDEASVWSVSEIKHYKKWASGSQVKSVLEATPSSARLANVLSASALSPTAEADSDWNHEYILIKLVSCEDPDAVSFVTVEKGGSCRHCSCLPQKLSSVAPSDSKPFA